MPTADSDPSERLRREREFHDERYAADNRHRADKFYAAASASSNRYDELLKVAPGARVLEYGCGTGSAAFDLAAGGATVTGIDISPTAIELAGQEAERRGLDGLDFREMNAEALEFEADSFDFVCGSGILHHLDIARAFDELARVLRPDGSAVFSEPMGHNPLINFYRRRTPEMRTVDEHPLLLSDIEAAKRRFGRVDDEYFELASIASAPLQRFRVGPRAAESLEHLDRWIFRRVPFARRYAWMVILRLAQPRSS